jgi:hypothetical protein
MSNLDTLKNGAFPIANHTVDFCVVGGGMAGVCAALAAARHGAQVLLMHERPVLGGNASSEMRMHICGADRHGGIPNMRETGILEELRLENLRRNPHQNAYIWDLILYEKLQFQPGLTILLNCSCLDAEMDGDRIVSVTGWQQTTQIVHTVKASIFADSSGDAILAPLSGAEFRMGREGRSEYGESIAPIEPDSRTMGMTCLFGSRKYDTPQLYTAPDWAYTFKDDSELPYGPSQHESWWELGYWWVEYGGMGNSIDDTETNRDELLKIALGVWDHIKNHGDHGADNYALDWLQFLPAKRESRRYIGGHVLKQSDIATGGKFDDIVAYGGWSMDDHDPAGFWAVKIGAPATIFHEAPSPFGIPYGSLYSRNIANLMFAGRNASCTHAAMSSTRVMGTACSMGQAAGTAAAIAVQNGLNPSEVSIRHIPQLQQTLLQDDAYLPWLPMTLPTAALSAKLTASIGDPEPLRDGINRPVEDNLHAWKCSPGDWVEYTFNNPQTVKSISLVVNSALDKTIAMSLHEAPSGHQTSLPAELPRSIRLDGLIDGQWTVLHTVTENASRLIRIPVNQQVSGLRVTLESTWGAQSTWFHLFTFDTAE